VKSAALGLLALGVVALPASAQERIEAGSRVRLVAPALGPDVVETRVIRMAGDSLVLQSDPRLPELTIARSDLTRIDVPSGRGNGRNRLIGVWMGSGFAAGALLGLTVGGYVSDPNLQKSNEMGRAAKGGLLGAGLGILLGAAVGTARKEPTWKTVDHRTVSLAVRPIVGPRLGAAVQLGF